VLTKFSFHQQFDVAYQHGLGQQPNKKNHTGSTFVSNEVLLLSVYLDNQRPTRKSANQQTNKELSCTRMIVASINNEDNLPR